MFLVKCLFKAFAHFSFGVCFFIVLLCVLCLLGSTEVPGGFVSRPAPTHVYILNYREVTSVVNDTCVPCTCACWYLLYCVLAWR